MSDLSLIPLQDGFETQLSQDWDGNTGTIYVLATPSYTPTTTNTYIVVNPGKTNMQIAEITDYDSTAKTLTVSSISFEKGLGISSTAQSHSTGSKVIISDNYQFWEDIQTAINTKLDDTGGTMTGLLQFTGTTHAGIKLLSLTTTQRDALSASNGMLIYNSTTGELNQYIGGAWSAVAAGSTQPTASTTVLGKIKTDVTPAGDPVALISDNPKYDALSGQGTPSSTNLYETQYDTSNGATKTATTISFTSGTKTIADSGNGFVTAGFKQGTQITITGSASNNGTYTIVSVAAGAIVVAETLVNESAGASVTITSVTANKLVRYNSDGDIGGTPSDAFFGDGSDGDVTISVDTNLGRDMYYNNLTINNGITLSPKGFRIFVKGTLACTGTGKIASNGGAGGAGAVGGAATPAGGTAGAIDYANGTLPTPKAGVVGTVGQQSAAGGGVSGLAVTLNETNSVAVAGGNSGRGSHSAPTGIGGAAGSPGTQPVMRPHNFISAYNLYDVIGVTFTKHDIAPTGGSGAGGGGNGTTVYGGGGGGSGSTGGFIAIFAKTISSLNVEAIGGDGGDGGAATSNNGGGGGGAGGNGGYILLFYKTKVSVTSNVSGGVGGVGGAIGTGTSGAGTAGTSGNPGVVNEISI